MPVEILVDGRSVLVESGSNLLFALRGAGCDLPGLCSNQREGYAPRSSCRLCLVEVEGTAGLVPACRTSARDGMVLRTASSRLERLRKTLRALTAEPGPIAPPMSSASLSFDPSACIRCGMCRDACQDVQGNGVIGIAGRGSQSRIVFDADAALSESSCVSCGECAQVCPTGALQLTGGVSQDIPLGDTVCPYCSVGCRITLTKSADGRILGKGANGPANKGRLCVKGRFGFEPLAHEDRLRVPLIRITPASKIAVLEADLKAESAAIAELFRPATWKEALDVAARGLKAALTAHGSDKIAILGSGKASNEDAYILQKLGRVALKTRHIDHCTRLCASVPPLTEATGFAAVTVPIEDVAEADVVLMVGSNPEVNHPVGATFLKNAIAQGTKLILLDPYRQPLARHAHQHLALRPGSDVTVLSSMLHVVIAEGLYDREFVRDHIDGFDDLAKAVAEMTPAIAEKVSGVPSQDIEAAARLFATAPRAIAFWGMGASQHVHGADNIRCVVSLALICGHVGKPGSGLHPLRGQNNVQGSCDAGLLPSSLPGYHSVSDKTSRDKFERAWACELPEGKGLSLCEIMDAAGEGGIKALYVAGGNPAMANPDLSRTRAGLARLEYLIVQDIFLTETALLADVILPACAIAERSGTYTSTDRIVQRTAPALEPPGEAMPDWWITREIAQRLGTTWGNVELDDIFDELAEHVPMLSGLTSAQLRNLTSVQVPLGQPASLFRHSFPTPTGRARLRAVTSLSHGELPDGSYPFILMTGRVREHWHTGAMTRRSATLDKLAPRAELRVAASDFDRLALRHEQPVIVQTRRGRVQVACVRDERQQDGVLFLPFAFHEAAANLLTGASLDPTTRVPEYKFCAARIEQIDAVQGHDA